MRSLPIKKRNGLGIVLYEIVNHERCLLIAFFVERSEFLHVVLESAHLHGFHGSDDEDASLFLHSFHEFELSAIVFVAVAQEEAQARIVSIDETWHFSVFVGGSVSFVSGENHNIEGVSCGDGALHGDGVDDSSVKHEISVDVHHGADEG